MAGLHGLLAAAAAAAAPDDPIVGVFIGSHTTSTNATNYTFTDKGIGTASADRVVVVRVTQLGGIIDKMTIGGVKAVKAISAGTTNNISEIWFANVPTGTTATIVITGTISSVGCGIAISTMTNTGGGPSDAAQDISGALSQSLTIPEGGAAVGVACNNVAGTPTTVWANLTEEYDEAVDTNRSQSGASSSTAGTPTITATFTPSGSDNFALAAWGTPSQYVARAVAAATDDDASIGADIGGSDGKNVTISFWIKTTNAVENYVLTGAPAGAQLDISDIAGDGKWHLRGFNAANAKILDLSVDTAINDGAWHHVMMSADLLNGVGHVYVDGVEDQEAGATLTNDTLDLTDTDWHLFTDGSAQLTADVADIYMAFEYIDLSDSANRLKFYSATGKPVDLGVHGKTPTGTAAILLLALYGGADVVSFYDNKGAGEDFTTIAGTLTEAAVSPSALGPMVKGQTNAFTSASTSHSPTMPVGIASGELLLALFHVSLGASETITTPTGWTELFKLGEGAGDCFAGYYKTAAGSDTITLTVSASRESISHIYRINNANLTPESTESEAGIDPPSITPSWGAKDNLIIAAANQKDDNLTQGGVPTNYYHQIEYEDVANTMEVFSCQRHVNGTSEDPGAFSGSGDNAVTIAIEPAD